MNAVIVSRIPQILGRTPLCEPRQGTHLDECGVTPRREPLWTTNALGVALLEGPVIRGFSVNEPLILLQAPPDSLHNPPSEAFWGVGLLGWH
ncbi:hypothetical protein FEAC_20560 [Ferrimicrobium acidiphilum DSM 19497]|uniref:Uncharacterized protein n=1 Tax=Ferrimicrobium acidiphilum DSM 19497 TaxID=1121877 RepID=A0A0D8FTB6_9ACTN|nr:hypothetical protein FEAC_20560 [Ferrimicrobium acidiphilum DSM 19497]